MHRIRTATLLCVALAVLFAGSVQAAAPLTYADHRGDALDRRGSMDILRVTVDKRQVNRTGPKSLVFELELAAPPETQLATYGIRTVMEGCGAFQAQFRPGGLVWRAGGARAAEFWTGCVTRHLPAEFKVDGNVLQWTIPLNHLPQEAGELGEIRAYTSASEPVTGFYGTGNYEDIDGPLPIDFATTDKTWSY